MQLAPLIYKCEKQKAGPASHDWVKRVASHMCIEGSSEKQKNLSYPYPAIQRTGAIAGPVFTQVPHAGQVSPLSKLSPFLLWQPGDHRPSRNQIWGARLSISSHQPTLTSVSGISSQGLPWNSGPVLSVNYILRAD